VVLTTMMRHLRGRRESAGGLVRRAGPYATSTARGTGEVTQPVGRRLGGY